MKNNIEAYSSKKLQNLFFGAICAILALPIIILPPVFKPSNWSRVILFKIILTCLVSFLFYRFFYKKDFSLAIFTKKNPAVLLLVVLSLFFFVLILSTIFSVDVRFSIFGDPGRSGGMINLLAYFIFAIFISIFIKEEYWEKLLKVNFIFGAIAGIFAVIQYFGIFNNIFVSFSVGGAGAPSFLGNSTFLAVYMLFLTFLAFYFFIQSKVKNQKILYGSLFFLFLLTIIISGSRATYLGALVGFVFYFLFYPKKLKVLKIFAASLLGLAITIVLLFNFFPQLGQKSSLLTTISSRVSISKIISDLAGNRLPAWEMTWQAIKEKPLLGWGPENFYVGFEKYYSPVNDSLKKEWWDRPHNIFLDIFIHYGIFALILYVSFWCLILAKLQIFKNKEQDQSKVYLAHAIQAMFLGYLTVLFFNFDEFPTYLMSFFFIGLSIYLVSTHGERKEILPPKNIFLTKGPIGLILLILVCLFIWFWNIKPLYLNEKLSWIGNLINQQNCEKGILATENTWQKSGILKTYFVLSYVDFIKKCEVTNPDKEVEYSQSTMAGLEVINKLQPYYSRTWLSMGGLSDVLAAREEDLTKRKEILAKSKGYLQEALKLSPKRQEILAEMEVNYMVSEDYESMKKNGEDCIKINPTQGFCYWYLGIAQIFTGDIKNGESNIEESKKQGYTNPTLLQLAIAYLSQNDYKKAGEIYDQLVKDYHENAGYHAVAAVLAKENGDYQKAAKETLEVFRIQPQNTESLQFLEMLFDVKTNDPVVLSSLAYVYKEVGNKQNNNSFLKNAVSIYLRLTAAYPNDADYHYQLGDTYNKLGEYYKAREELVLSAKLNSNYAESIQRMLNLLPIEESLKALN